LLNIVSDFLDQWLANILHSRNIVEKIIHFLVVNL